MLISHKKLREINDVQVDILKEVSDVCKKLNIKFFMVHGSLLGTIRNNKFVPDDDDIDIALFREDYETFLKEAPKIMPEYYFVQSNSTDNQYPLEFAKVRDSRTTYIIDIAKKLKINHGIYIDVFPIDYYPENKVKAKIYNIKNRLLKLRISCVWDITTKSTLKKIADLVVKCIYPDVKKAIHRLDKNLKYVKNSNLVKVSGGKTKESGIPKFWFKDAINNVFEGVDVYIPSGYDNYLRKIYGEYETRTLVESKEVDDINIEVNACMVDLERPYTGMV